MMSVSYDAYKVFYYVAYYQNITLAAKALFLTQPTVSHYILNLEKELNCKLFIRSKKGMYLSPEGEMLYSHISKAYAEISAGEEQLKEYLNMEKGLIKIGASETSLRSYLIPFLGKFKEKYPDIHLHITNTTYQLADDLILNGSIDFAVMTTPFPESTLNTCRLTDFSMACIAGPAFSHLADRPMTYQELAEYPLICLESGTSGRMYLETLFASHGIYLKPDIELSSADLITPMAELNMGIGFVPRILADQVLWSRRVVELTLEETLPVRTVCILSDPQKKLSVTCQKFMTEMGVQ
ncbi:MAG: LysR family transcriptional regulator [Brotaphodocola sp.]